MAGGRALWELEGNWLRFGPLEEKKGFFYEFNIKKKN